MKPAPHGASLVQPEVEPRAHGAQWRIPNGTYGRDMHDERIDERMHDPLCELCPVPLMISEVIKM